MLKVFTKNALFFINKNPISRKIYNNEVIKRSKLPLTEISSLSKSIQLFSPFTNEAHIPNDWYSHAKHFKNYMHLPQSYQFKFIIEHGSYLTPEISPVETNPKFSIIITTNKYRAKLLKEYKEFPFSIGPFIHYVPHFYPREKIEAEKKRLGKNILLFPGHSVTRHIQKFNNRWFIQNVKRIAKDFDTIRICLYWVDIQMGLHKYYKDLGFECVTAGHILDPMFLPRIKSLIEIADLTISNDISTHIGLSIYLNKPHILFHRYPKLIVDRKWEKKITTRQWKSKPFQDILDTFSKINYKITAQQRKVASKYYGGKDDIKTKEEFKKIVDFAEKNYQKN